MGSWVYEKVKQLVLMCECCIIIKSADVSYLYILLNDIIFRVN